MAKPLWQRPAKGAPSEWWTEHLSDETVDEFLQQMGGPDRQQSVDFRAFSKDNDVTSVLDCGGGPLIDWKGFRDAGLTRDYCILDSAPYWAERAKRYGARVEPGSIEAIPFPDDSFDLVYARHVLIHLPYYETAIQEMARVARRFVYVAMPYALKDKDTLQKHRLGVWSNFYGGTKMIEFCKVLPGAGALTYESRGKASRLILSKKAEGEG